MSALDFLQKQEWSMGNGQCPTCHGCGLVFASWQAPPRLGHKADCSLAASLKELGGEPIMVGDLPDDGTDPYAEQRAGWDAMNRKFMEGFEKDLLRSLGLTP